MPRHSKGQNSAIIFGVGLIVAIALLAVIKIMTDPFNLSP